MKFHYYHDTESLYVEFRPEPGVKTREIADGLNVDLDARGNVVGFDVDLAAEGLDPREAMTALTTMGPAVSEAVRLLFHRIAIDRTLPLELKVPNALTRQAMAEVDEMVQRHRARFAKADEALPSLKKPAASRQAPAEDLELRAGDEIEVASRAPGKLVVARDERRERAAERMRRRAWAAPEGYVFDRDEANQR